MFFDDIGDLGRVAPAGTLGYFALVAILRVSGKRTLSKVNAFDLVVTVAWTSVRFPRRSGACEVGAASHRPPGPGAHRRPAGPSASRRRRSSKAVRSQGHPSPEDVEAVVLETDGTMSVVAGAGPDASALAGVARASEP